MKHIYKHQIAHYSKGGESGSQVMGPTYADDHTVQPPTPLRLPLNADQQARSPAQPAEGPSGRESARQAAAAAGSARLLSRTATKFTKLDLYQASKQDKSRGRKSNTPTSITQSRPLPSASQPRPQTTMADKLWQIKQLTFTNHTAWRRSLIVMGMRDEYKYHNHLTQDVTAPADATEEQLQKIELRKLCDLA